MKKFRVITNSLIALISTAILAGNVQAEECESVEMYSDEYGEYEIVTCYEDGHLVSESGYSDSSGYYDRSYEYDGDHVVYETGYADNMGNYEKTYEYNGDQVVHEHLDLSEDERVVYHDKYYTNGILASESGIDMDGYDYEKNYDATGQTVVSGYSYDAGFNAERGIYLDKITYGNGETTSTTVQQQSRWEESCGENCSYTFENGVLTFSGTTVDSDRWGRPWEFVSAFGQTYWTGEAIESIVIEEGVTEIGNAPDYYGRSTGVFYFETPNLTSITLPSTLEKIGDCAFEWSENLKEINIPEGVTEIGARAFSQTGIESINLPEGITSIAPGTFENCYYLTDITIPANVTSIGDNAFCRAGELGKIIFAGDTIPDIGKAAFESTPDNMIINFNNTDENRSKLIAQLQNAGERHYSTGIYDPKIAVLEGRNADGSTSTYEYDISNGSYGLSYTTFYNEDGTYLRVYPDGSRKTFASDGNEISEGTAPSSEEITDAASEKKGLKRRIYTISEATEVLGKSGRNTFILKYR